jgi:poly(A) polymerase
MALPKAFKMQINNGWIKSKGAQHILKILENAGHSAYFVGGCVRNSVLSIAVNDIDISTDATPEETLSLFDIDNFKVIQTGFSHGTITVISAGIPYQITTMRKDQNTDGRHADVRFSDNITEDAKRRDFTINALYANSFGEIIDPLGSLKDFNPLKIKFIGNASHRIKEDYLRILRFFSISCSVL